MAYNNHEYGRKSTYRQHMECLNNSWLTTIMSTVPRVSIVNTWNAKIPHGLQQSSVKQQENLYSTQRMLKYLMAYNNHELHQEYLSSTHGMLKYLMAYNNHEYGIYQQWNA